MFNNFIFNNNVDNRFDLFWCAALKQGELDDPIEGIDLMETTMQILLSAMPRRSLASAQYPLAGVGGCV
jgi:hypothetical protein